MIKKNKFLGWGFYFSFGGEEDICEYRFVEVKKST